MDGQPDGGLREQCVGDTVTHQRRYYISSLPGDARSGYATQNAAQLRRYALNLLRRESTARVGIKAKRLKAGWSDDYLAAVLCA
jgi:hypothetical protein